MIHLIDDLLAYIWSFYIETEHDLANLSGVVTRERCKRLRDKWVAQRGITRTISPNFSLKLRPTDFTFFPQTYPSNKFYILSYITGTSICHSHRDYPAIIGVPSSDTEESKSIDIDLDKLKFRPGFELWWFSFGFCERENDQPSCMEFQSTEWRQRGLLHRENDLPARVAHNLKEWFSHGVLHRVNGPARIFTNFEGTETVSVWIENGNFLYRKST